MYEKLTQHSFPRRFLRRHSYNRIFSITHKYPDRDHSQTFSRHLANVVVFFRSFQAYPKVPFLRAF